MSHAAVVDTPVTNKKGIPFVRLVAVEVRKSFDTRAGRWFSALILGICLVAVVIFALAASAGGGGVGYADMLSVAGGVLGYFLPIISILLITQEWGQRTALTTFALEPRRSRIIMAKLVASIAIAVVVMAVAGVIAIVGTLIVSARGGNPDWNVSGAQLAGFALQNALAVIVGFAIATLLLNTAAAIVVYFIWSLVLPIVVQVLGVLVHWFGQLAPWIEFNLASAPLYSGDHVSGKEWGQIATSGFIWIVLPFTLGLIRILRAEVK